MSNQTQIEAIDQLGIVRAKIADLKIIEDELKDKLGDLGPGAYEGQIFRLAVIETVQERIDCKAAREFLPEAMLKLLTKEVAMRTLKTNSRTGKVSVAA